MQEILSRDPYGTALQRLRDLAGGGRFGWGQPLVVKDLAQEIGLSHTPIREALACLAGEGLIERRRGRGYFFPSLTAADVIDLFDLEWAYVHAALTVHAPRPANLRRAADASLRPDFGLMFEGFVGLSGNVALARAFRLLAERLAPVRRAVARLDPVWSPDAGALAAAARAGEAQELVRLISSHHLQRCDLAGDIAHDLQRIG